MSYVWLIVTVFLSSVPSLVFAQTPEAITNMPDELVPCGDPGQPTCQTCHLYQLVENVFAWVFGLATFVVIVLIIYGGFRLATSTGNQMAKRDARKIISSAIIGFVLVLSAWMLVELMITTLSGAEGSGSIWTSLQCVDQPDAGVSGADASVTDMGVSGAGGGGVSGGGSGGLGGDGW
jgi:hypothetical protein